MKLNELVKLFRTRQVAPGHWTRFATRGSLELCCYDTGLYELYVKVARPNPNENCVLFHIGTLDDGEFQAWAQNMPLDEAIKLADRVGQELLPELNSLLKKYKMYGEIW
jgi:hypothetical protein